MKYLMTSASVDSVQLEPVALAINLAQDPRNAAVMCKGKGLGVLLSRALKASDPVLLKLVRTLAAHKSIKEMLLDFVDALAGELHKAHAHNDGDMLVEVWGVGGWGCEIKS